MQVSTGQSLTVRHGRGVEQQKRNEQTVQNNQQLQLNTKADPSALSKAISSSGGDKELLEKQKAMAMQRVDLLGKRVATMEKLVSKISSEAHAKVMVTHIKLLSRELKNAVAQFNQANKKLHRLQQNQQQSPGQVGLEKIKQQQEGDTLAVTTASAPEAPKTMPTPGSDMNSRFKEMLAKVKKSLKFILSIANAHMKEQEDKQEVKKLDKTLDKIQLESESSNLQTGHLSLGLSEPGDGLEALAATLGQFIDSNA